MIEWFEMISGDSVSMIFVALGAFLFVAGRELSEHAKENGFLDWGSWWNTGQSHRNKYNWDDVVLDYLSNAFPSIFKRMWITRIIGRILSAAFKTALVWTTDAEHFFQIISLVGVLISVWILGDWQWMVWFYIINAMVGFLKAFTNIK